MARRLSGTKAASSSAASEVYKSPARASTTTEITPKEIDLHKNTPLQTKWAPFTDISSEHYQPEPTRIGHNPHNTNDKYLIASRIDRIYSSLLPLSLIHIFEPTRLTRTSYAVPSLIK